MMAKQCPRELRKRAVRLVAERRGENETEYAAVVCGPIADSISALSLNAT